ncbi:MAG: hypothetical protein AB1704_36035 [Pseudomonadota bacterium]|uniref:hypothetical protein n=1 Tax=Burkholderiaceae TaxID=119060 RepID=UPI0010F96287|nr:hypothetical protein [Burkholderia sp. 4M9327F10]
MSKFDFKRITQRHEERDEFGTGRNEYGIDCSRHAGFIWHLQHECERPIRFRVAGTHRGAKALRQVRARRLLSEGELANPNQTQGACS